MRRKISTAAKTTPETDIAVQGLLKSFEGGRADLATFYQLVMREETKKTHLIPAPHQRVLFSFIQDHKWCVCRLPVGTGKTYAMAAFTLWLLGNDTTQRGAILSNTRGQAAKVVQMVGSYITEPELNAPLTLVFPWLQPSKRHGDPWTQTQITIQRDPAIRDASLTAVGHRGEIAGSRLSWLNTDDMVSGENSLTKNLKEAMQGRFDGKFLSRLDPVDSRVCFTNTPWFIDDQSYHLENNAGWPTLEMDIYGFIRFRNASAGWIHDALEKHLTLSNIRAGQEYDWYRLQAHGRDDKEEIPLWPFRYSAERIKQIRYGMDGKSGMLPHEFARAFLCRPISETDARCQRGWIEKCKARGVGMTLEPSYDGGNPTYTGIDLAVGQDRANDLTAFFTFVVHDDGSRQILDLESGRFSGPVIVDKLVDKAQRYKSAIGVETNAAQDYVRQFALEKASNINIKAHNTTRAGKQNLDFGVESVFTELRNGTWIIPCDRNGKCHREIQDWIDEMIYYQPPPAHVGDRIMACWIAREMVRKGGRRDPPPRVGDTRALSFTGGF